MSGLIKFKSQSSSRSTIQALKRQHCRFSSGVASVLAESVRQGRKLLKELRCWPRGLSCSFSISAERDKAALERRQSLGEARLRALSYFGL